METIEKMRQNAIDSHLTSIPVEKRKLIKRQSIIYSKKQMSESIEIKDKLAKLYQSTMNNFSSSIMHFETYKDKIGIAKATFLRA